MYFWFDDPLPFFVRIGVETIHPFLVGGLFQQRRDGRQAFLDVGQHRNVNLNVFIDFCRVNVEVDDLGLFGVGLEVAGHTVVKPHANGYQHIAFSRFTVGAHIPVHAQHTLHQGKITGNSGQTQEGGTSRNVGFGQKGLQFLFSLSQNNPLTHQGQRTFGRIDQRGGFFNSCLVYIGIGLIAPDKVAFLVHIIRQFILRILGNVKHHRTWPSFTGDVESPGNSPRNFSGCPYLVTPFGHG